MTTCRLIVHADDFGLSPSVNHGIVEAHCRGIVTSTSIMACGAAFEHAVALARSTPTLDVGVHLTLTEEPPVSSPERIPSLVAPDGRFHEHTSSFVRQWITGRVSLDEVELELDAQIRRVVDQGVAVSHLDGHQHVHMVPGIRRVVGCLAARYDIHAVRYPREAPRPYMVAEVKSAPRLIRLLALNAFCMAAGAQREMRPDHFFGFFFGGRLTKANLLKVFEGLPRRGVCELMCHPGQPEGDSAHAHWHYRWQDELDALTDKAVAATLRAKGVELTSYAALTRP